MHELDCPRCGRRPLDEFAFGGERRSVLASLTDPDDRDFDAVFLFDNPAGPATERWFHAAGCRRWLTVVRDVAADASSRCAELGGYAERRLDILARDHARFGAGIVAELPEAIAGLGAGTAFVVTDPGVVASGVAGRVVDALLAAGLAVDLFDRVEPNPGTATIEAGSDRLHSFFGGPPGFGIAVVALGGGSAMDAAKVIALHGNQSACGHGTRLPR